MTKSPIPSLDMTKEKSFLILNPNHSFLKIYQTKLPEQKLIHFAHPACEYEETSFKQHGIVVHLRPEHNSIRRMGELVEIENVKVGDMAIVPANVNHWQRIETKICEAIVLTIEPQLISCIAHEAVNPECVELLPTFAKSDSLIQHLALNLKANLDSANCDPLYTESLFHTLSMHLLRNYTTRKFLLKTYSNGLPPYKLRQAINYINDNLDQPIKLTDIAQLIDISQFYFCRLFRESTGVAPYKYVIQQRVAKAKDLIENTKLPLSDISERCGFSSQSQMTQHFRKSVGVTPKKNLGKSGQPSLKVLICRQSYRPQAGGFYK